MTFLTDIKTTTDTIYDPEQEQPARMYWYNGAKSARTGGVFHIKFDELGHTPQEPWKDSERFDNEAGFETDSLRIAVIGQRQQAFRSIKDGNQERREWLARWEQGAQLYTEVLCMVQGIEQPVVWVMKGLTGKAVTGKGGILNHYKNGLLRDATRLANKPLNPWAFWLPISTIKDAQGKIKYEDTGFGSTVTPPALFLPQGDVESMINELWIGADLYEECGRIREQFDAWLHEQRGIEPAPPVTQEPRTPLVLEEADLPEDLAF